MADPYNPSKTQPAAADAAWQRIGTLGIPPTPEAYALFYDYYQGQDANLVRELDQIIARAGNLPEPLTQGLQHLYEKHLRSSRQEAQLHSATENFDGELKKIMTLIETSQQGQDAYGDALDAFHQELQPEDMSLEKMRYLITQMVAETKQVSSQNKALQEQLVASSTQLTSLKTNLEEVRKETLVDALTGIGNRKAFTDAIARCIAETQIAGEPLALLMVDIDHFKRFNDIHGHLVGDQVLKLVAHVLKENTKGRDFVARWGGEEFAILLPQTQLENAMTVGNHLRHLMETKKIVRKPNNMDLGTITLSMGATTYRAGEDADSFLNRADQGLYQAKGNGRNRVEAMIN